MRTLLSKERRRELYVNYGRFFLNKEGRPPSRLDFRGENLERYREAHGIQYPTAKQVETVFGRWGKYVEVVGGTPVSPKIAVGNAAIRFMKEQFGLVEEDAHMGAIDGTIDGRTVEVKGATIGLDRTMGHPRWRFRLHHRKYSLMVDELWLVGLDGDRALAAWKLGKADMARFIDGRDAISIAVAPLFKGRWYNLLPHEVWKAQLSIEEVDAILRQGTEPPRWPKSEAV
jgi:hypothetical protein